jgi:hypothetical protein
MTPYLYWPVSGAILFWRKPGTICTAKASVARHRQQFPEAEIERVLEVGNNGRRYWRWRDGKWSLDFTSKPSEQDLEKWR